VHFNILPPWSDVGGGRMFGMALASGSKMELSPK